MVLLPFQKPYYTFFSFSIFNKAYYISIYEEQIILCCFRKTISLTTLSFNY